MSRADSKRPVFDAALRIDSKIRNAWRNDSGVSEGVDGGTGYRRVVHLLANVRERRVTVKQLNKSPFWPLLKASVGEVKTPGVDVIFEELP